jgi:hypothetical protein
LTRALKSEKVRVALAPYFGTEHDLIVQRGDLSGDIDPLEPARKELGLTKPSIALGGQNCSSATDCGAVPAKQLAS